MASFLRKIILNLSKYSALYDLFILFLTNFLHLEQSIQLKAGSSHDFRKCSNSFLEKLSEDKGIFFSL